MVVILGDKIVVVLLDQQLLVAQEFGSADFTDNLVIHFGPGLNKFKLSVITMSHPLIKLALKQKGYHKPVNANQAVLVIF